MHAAQPNMLLKNAQIVDGSTDRARDGFDILVADGKIQEVSERPLQVKAEVEIDLAGRFLLPGLIDCHVHAIATTVRLADNALMPDSLITAKSIGILGGMLDRGFTTVRDAGGADFGLQQAIEQSLIEGPRLVICGKALSQTGGHSDFRGRYDSRSTKWFGNRLGSLGYAVDGVENLRLAIRNQIKGGAQYVKLMVNGGVASPTDPINFLGYSRDEIKTAVEEAKMSQTYVAGHLYTADSIKRAVECGLRSVEHATLIDDEGAAMISDADGVAVPTLIVFEALHREGAQLGFPADSVAKIDDVRLPGLSSLETLQRAGVTMGYGSDLLGELHQYQSEEFILRAQVLPRHDVIRAATLDAAKVLQMEGQIGCIEPGAFADLIVMNKNPLDDMACMTEQGKHMSLIMKQGRLRKNTLE